MKQINQKPAKKQSPRQQDGDFAELLARQYLEAQGLRFIQHQFRVPCGEIDLVMQAEEELVFVEVRYRETSLYGDPEESIGYYKQRSLIRAAQMFQQRHPWTDYLDARFDVVGITGNKLNPKINWIENAFPVE